VIIDHVAWLVADAGETARDLRERHGLGSLPGMFFEHAGTRHVNVPLQPPQMLELLTIEDRDAAAATEAGRRALACEAAGCGLLAWCVLVDDLEAVSNRLGIEIRDFTVPHGDGTLRGWRSVSGAAHLPFFLDYPRNGDRAGRIRALYERAGHSSAPECFSGLTISGSASEHDEWLGPHGLPLRFVPGRRGIVEARIRTVRGDTVIP
jgi:hypothetical protein